MTTTVTTTTTTTSASISTTETTTDPITTATSSVTTATEILEYQNPVFEPVLADPSIIKGDDGIYYAFGTQDYGEWGDTFGTKYGPILQSENLVDWTYAGSVFTLATRPTWGTPNAGIWAPDIVKIGENYLYYYSLSVWGDPNPGIGVASASHPLGPWTDHGKLLDSVSIGVNNSIDPSVFIGQDGEVYIAWGSFRGIYGTRLTSDGLALLDGANAINTKVRIAGYDTSTNWNGSTYEGTYIIYKDGYYYMFVSSGTCCDGFSSSYNVKVARSENPLGPYYDSEGRDMLAGNRGHQVLIGSSYFAGPGHNSIIIDEAGDYWIVYHAYDTSESPTFGNSPRRSLMIDKLVWDDLGWPTVRGTLPSNSLVDVPQT
ncbi:MAG: family 43 glycosylhydrolase [Bacilli bacterium]|nr:family 43 glycosylhydrolase [Bacilli bacterium]